MQVAEHLQKLKPYVVGLSDSEEDFKKKHGLSRLCHLASNENPLGPSPKVVASLQKKLIASKGFSFSRYPNSQDIHLLRALSEQWQVPISSMALGNGSNEIIDLLIRAYGTGKDRAVLLSEKSFIAYTLCAYIAHAEQIVLPLRDEKNFQSHLALIAQKVQERERQKKLSLIFMANPNNPTGVYHSRKEMEAFLQDIAECEGCLCVVDEAYNEFVRGDSSSSLVGLLPQYKNLLVLRTFSKVYGLAALRLGVLVAPPSVIENFHRVRNPFNVNQFAILAALEALKDKEHLKASQEQAWRGLDFFYRQLKNLGLNFIPSQGNFVMFRGTPTLSASQIHDFLLKKGVLLRPLQPYGLNEWLRMSVGKDDENVLAMESLKQAL